jgi:phosphorylcholine metabolism protein LicD
MGLFRKTRRRIRQRLYFTPEKMLQRLHRFHDLMSQTPLADKYWICGGMLIGYAREGKLLAHDTDFDFHYWREDHQDLMEAIKTLEQAGFRKEACWINNEGHATEYVLNYGRIKFEFFEATRHENRIRWYCYLPKPKRQFLNEVPGYDLEPFEFCERQWLKPVDEQQYLESLYGDWKTPCSDYTYYIDSKAIIQRDRWEGTNQW